MSPLNIVRVRIVTPQDQLIVETEMPLNSNYSRLLNRAETEAKKYGDLACPSHFRNQVLTVWVKQAPAEEAKAKAARTEALAEINRALGTNYQDQFCHKNATVEVREGGRVNIQLHSIDPALAKCVLAML